MRGNMITTIRFVLDLKCSTLYAPKRIDWYDRWLALLKWGHLRDLRETRTRHHRERRIPDERWVDIGEAAPIEMRSAAILDYVDIRASRT